MAVRRLYEKAGNCLVLGQITGIKLVILALFGDQLVVAAALDDAALFQHHDAVCIADGGQAVRDDKAGAAIHQAVHAALHQSLGAGVDGGSSLIEDEHRRVGRWPCDRFAPSPVSMVL